jgi:hypothetical protein
MPTRRTALAAVALAAACSDSPEGPPIDPPPPPPPSQNPIDVAIWPRMIAGGHTTLVPAPPAELCRRMALDLIGVAPDANEIATICDGKTPEQIARGFLAHPRFVDVERRWWIRRIGADPTAHMGVLIKDADRIFDAAATGAIDYDDLVAQLVAHPVMTINRPAADADDVTATVRTIFRVVLGRAPSRAELDDYANLLRPWRRRFEDRYDLGYGYYVYPAALVPGACADPVLGEAACTSTLLGARTTMHPQVVPAVPPGYSQTAANLFYYETVLGAVPAELQAELEKPGRLLVTRDEAWDEIADAALARFVGWWRSTANEPDTVLPEVRRALADHFRALPVHDLRDLYVVIATSLLYTTSAAVAVDAPELPPWATGPTKVLEPEQLLDSVERALGRELGLCDPHTAEEVGLDWYWPAVLRPAQPADWYGFGYDFYRRAGQELGGCLGAIAPPAQPGLPALFAHIDLADRLCDPPSVLLPTGVDPQATTPEALTATADHLFAQFLSRPPGADERVDLQAAVTACQNDSGCGTAERFARETCGALLRSAAFLYH